MKVFLNIFRIISMLVCGVILSFGSPGHRQSLIPPVSYFKRIKLFFCRFTSYLRFTITSVGTIFSSSIRICHKTFLAVSTNMFYPIIVHRFPSNTTFGKFFKDFFMMINSVLAICFAKFQIFYSIICNYSVFVMNTFFRVKISPKMFFHYKPVFSNIALFTRKRMIMIKDIPVSCPFNFA